MEQVRAEPRGIAKHLAYSTSTATSEDLADTLGAMARDLARHDDSTTLLDAIVATAVAIVPGAEGGSISVLDGQRQVVPIAATCDLAGELDASLGTGHRPFTADWAETSATSVLSLQLHVDGKELGVLQLYSSTPYAFTDESERVGRLVATHAAIAYAGARKQEHLARALAGRDVIGQAKGILMERYRIADEQAFQILSRVSQNTNRKLHEVARELVESGTVGVASARYRDRRKPWSRRP